MADLLSFSNPVLAQFAFYTACVLLKTMFLSLWTVKTRNSKKIFANPEDCKINGVEKPILMDPDIERIRRCHQNDLENVIPFVLIGLLYILTDPDPWWAAFYFRTFVGMRIMHTIAYLTPLPQPTRASMFLGNMFINIAMSIRVLRAGVF